MTVQERWTPQTKKNVARHRPRRQINDLYAVIDGALSFGTEYIFRLRRQHRILVREFSVMEFETSGDLIGGVA